MLGIMESLEKVSDTFKQFILDNQNNPVLWIGLVVLGVALFGFTYSALSKNG